MFRLGNIKVIFELRNPYLGVRLVDVTDLIRFANIRAGYSENETCLLMIDKDTSDWNNFELQRNYVADRL